MQTLLGLMRGGPQVIDKLPFSASGDNTGAARVVSPAGSTRQLRTDTSLRLRPYRNSITVRSNLWRTDAVTTVLLHFGASQTLTRSSTAFHMHGVLQPLGWGAMQLLGWGAMQLLGWGAMQPVGRRTKYKRTSPSD